MKRLMVNALLFLVVLTGGSSDPRTTNEHDHRMNVSEMKINRSLLPQQWRDAALGFRPQTIEYGERGGEKFIAEFNQVVVRLGEEVSQTVYNQAVAVGQNLIHAAEDKWNKLVNSIGQSSNKDLKKNNVEESLQYLVHQLKIFLDLEPGNQKIEHEPLGNLPKIPTKILSQTKNRTASDIFLHFPKLANKDMSSVYGYLAGIYLTGWSEQRKYYDLQQTQYRNQILNGPVLNAYRKIVDRVFKNCDDIENRVSKDTWESFRAAGNHIIDISNEWQSILAKLES